MYQVEQNLHDDPNNDGFHTAVRISVRPTITFPFERDQTARTFTDQWVQQYDSFQPLAVGSCHPYLKKQIVGTIEVEKDSDEVVGLSTTFSSDFLVGDIIWVNEQSKVIQSIESDTELTLEELYDGISASGMNAFRSECYLTSEDGFSYMENGLMEFNRNYASLPEGRIEWGTTGFTFPAFKNLSADTANPIRKSFNQNVVARNSYSYIRTNSPATELVISPKFEPLDASGNVVSFVATDSFPTLATYQGYISASTYIRSAETKVDPWMGNIWQMLNIEVIAK